MVFTQTARKQLTFPVLHAFPVAVINPLQKNFKNKGLIWLTVPGNSPFCGGIKVQELEAVTTLDPQ